MLNSNGFQVISIEPKAKEFRALNILLFYTV
jgi:hypothetical protein